MNISNVSMSGKTQPPVEMSEKLENPRENSALDKTAQSAPTLSQLSRVTDKASLSSLAPKLQNILQAIDHPDNNVLQAMSDNISNLQDVFVEAVSHTLGAAGIDLSHKVTLRLNQAGELGPAGEHPEKERIEAALAKAPELSSAFREIASQSELLRDVSNISKVIGAQTGLASYQNSY
ncbi:MAG: hypothetical protein LBM64_08640, partial [Deltaproteobacteria bacterium]|nr:hypothetical protein [Deltaproteobacteria bacterium]